MGYDFPHDDRIYLFYELRTMQTAITKQPKPSGFPEPVQNPFENLDFFESKRRAFSNLSEKSQGVDSLLEKNQNSRDGGKSLSLFSFSQRLPFKHTENFSQSPISNLKLLLNEKSNNENSELSRFLKKNSENGENFAGVSQFFENRNSLGAAGRNSNSLGEQGKIRKSQQHFQKISDIIDIISKSQEPSFSTFKENFGNKN